MEKREESYRIELVSNRKMRLRAHWNWTSLRTLSFVFVKHKSSHINGHTYSHTYIPTHIFKFYSLMLSFSKVSLLQSSVPKALDFKHNQRALLAILI